VARETEDAGGAGSRAEVRDEVVTGARPYWGPYRAGIGVGLTLLASFLIMGRGLGASGAFTSLVAAGVHAVAPGHAAENGMFSAYAGAPEKSLLSDRLVFEVLGVIVGGLLSGWLAGRRKVEVTRGPRTSVRSRLVLAFAGGVLMGFAAKLARGCTSSQGLSGGALLSVGSWVFMLSLFAAGYASSRLFRRQWS
jgi:uncharacterized protein